MSNPPRPLVAGNWKMNGTKASLAELQAICADVAAGRGGKAEILVCPPVTLLAPAVDLCGKGISAGAQDCHTGISGAHTGDISAAMLADAGASYVILGHSERRADHGESDSLVRAKALAALAAGLKPIVCVGETKAQREAGEAEAIVGGQLSGSLEAAMAAGSLVVAYEPVWAIGTGLTPTTADVAAMHAFMRRRLVEMFGPAASGIRILYGGSVKPGNAAELMAVPDVNGALVGGASLKAADFMGIAAAYK